MYIFHDLADFAKVIKKTELYRRMPFDIDNSLFMKLYFGNDKKRLINYTEFAQFLHVSYNFDSC